MLPSAQCKSTDDVPLSPQAYPDTTPSETKMRMPSTSTMIHAYKSLTPCTIYRVPTKSNAVPSSCVGFYRFPRHSHHFIHVSSLQHSATSGYWSFGQTAWITSSHCAATLRTTSSSLFGP